MPTQVITLQGGIRVEAEVTDTQVARKGGIVDKTLDEIKPTLTKVIQPVADIWKDLRQFSQSLDIQQAEIEVGLGFEASGNVFIAGSKGNVNLKIKLVIKQSAGNQVEQAAASSA